MFCRFYEQYDDVEIGALEVEEIHGPSDEIIEKKLLSFSNELDEEHLKIHKKYYCDDQNIKQTLSYSDSEPEEMENLDVNSNEKNKWDCKTNWYKNSKTGNQPGIIKEIKEKQKKNKIFVSQSTGIPKNEICEKSSQLLTKTLNKLQENCADCSNSLCNEAIILRFGALSMRPKTETNLEKKERKMLVKKYRRERRVEKKINAQAFKQEKIRVEKNNKSKQNHTLSLSKF